MKLFLVILFFIIFVPIPIKLSFFISRENYYLKLYRFYISKKQKNKNRTNSNIEIKKPPKIKTNEKPSLIKGLSVKTVIKIIKLFNNSKFKPTLRLNGYFSYSLGDAANTAIFYGVLSTYFPLLLFALNVIFKTKKFNLPINPVFKDEFIAETKITSIIMLSLAQITYMIILLIKTITILKEAKLERADI
ncbi:DUF2953 domain-containing protein [Clostridium vincentii]|uniref:DUF2953 domain-containing protein n=1 Tax=Clostridium vincentii TaxID=52704 RepID=A0A2T0BAG2_9CLOT|nr:DUF2953 domain-containing protein [Clostridium vincentii]PRR80878.1 hypothetical protein CLVI_29360 [Clostridium vincentii]